MKKLLLTCLLGLVMVDVPAQTAGNVPAKNTSLLPLPQGPSVLGVFDGRSPCQGIAREMGIKTIPECIKIKWRLVLYQDPVTQAPSTYELEGFVYRNPSRKGKWTIIRGMSGDPDALVIQLDPDQPEKTMYLLKADDNVLFFLDKQRRFMIGTEDFSYTLNRTGTE